MRGLTWPEVSKLAAAKIGAPTEWTAYLLDHAPGGMMVTGAVPFGVYTRGPRKGKPRLIHPKATHRAKVILSDADIAAAAEAYERETGNCSDCKGSGQVYAGWSRELGVHHKPCDRCGATGVAAQRREGGE